LSNKIKQAVVVAAGLGSRLKPYTNDLPKTLIEIDGATMIRRSIKIMLEHGIEEIIVVVGYKKELIAEHLKDYPVKFVHNPFYLITNNMASLWFAAPFLEGDFIYTHSDLVYDASLMKTIIESKYETALLVEEKHCSEEEMKVIAKDGLLVESSKLIDPKQSVGEWTGIARFSHKFTQILMHWIGTLLEDGHLQDYDTLAFTQLAQNGESIHIIKFKDKPWIEIDTAKDLMVARELARLPGF
jgi:choline kinase